MNAGWESLFADSLTLLPDSADPTDRDFDALAELPARRGVLLFADAHNQPIQLIQTANLRSLSRSRIAQGADEVPHRKADLAAVTQRIYYACCENDFQRQLLYQRLAHEVFGNAWKKWLVLPRRSYAILDRQRAFGSFAVTGSVEAGPSKDLFGPFANRRAAALFCESLNTAFELCRNLALLDSGNPQSCPYLQMHTCHGLCCQEHGQGVYANHLERALRCAEGDIAPAVEDLRRQMKQAAAGLDFETAQLRKKQADQLSRLCHPEFAWTARLATVRLVVVVFGGKAPAKDSNKKVRCWQLWLIDLDGVYLLGRFAEDDPETLRDLLSETLQPAQKPPPYPYARSRQEHLATVFWLLYRKNRPGLWYNAAHSVPEGATILDDVSASLPSGRA